MDIIKRKILLENSVDRDYNSITYGAITANTFYFKILLTQNIDDMGIFTDILYLPLTNDENLTTLPNYDILINKLNLSGFTFPFMSGVSTTLTTTDNSFTLRLPIYNVSNFYFYGFGNVSGYTDSKIELLKTYSNINKYINNFYINSENYIDFLGNTIIGGDVVTTIGEPSVYSFNLDKNDINSGTTNQNNGVLYFDYTGLTRNVDNNIINTSVFNINGEGWNSTNISLSALTKQEYLYGITEQPIVESDLFIDRGITTIMENHLRLSEIETLAHLELYGNRYYNLSKI